MRSNVVILGAPRSGTNMLRDVLTSINGIETWPCDEINYIWRHGNVRYPSDEIPAERATPEVQRYIRSKFDKMANKTRAQVLVEKTCANTLRVPFVERVIPEAKYIFIYRDGIDATGSAKLRWTAKLDIPYLLEKVRFVPTSDLPYYGGRYFWARIHRWFSKDKRLAFWGPALDDMQDVLNKHTLNEVCAIQWQRCVEKAGDALSNIPSSRVYKLSYEQFVTDPKSYLSEIVKFIGFEASECELENAIDTVSPKSLGKGRKALGEDEVQRLEMLVGTTLEKYGYK